MYSYIAIPIVVLTVARYANEIFKLKENLLLLANKFVHINEDRGY